MEVLLGNGAEIDIVSAIGSETPLVQTSKCGYVGIARRLLVAGAHVNHQSEDGSHALISACQFGHLDVVNLLLGKYLYFLAVDLFQVDKGRWLILSKIKVFLFWN